MVTNEFWKEVAKQAGTALDRVLVESHVREAIAPDAIFSADGVQVWPQSAHTVYYDVSVDYGLFQFNAPTREERLIHTDPGSDWGYYQQPNGDVSFRRKDKR